MVELAFATTMDEVESSLRMATDVFKSFGQSDQDDLKNLIWYQDPSFRPENIFIARESGQVIGVIRVVEREMFLGGSYVKAAGITSVCVTKNHRGLGISRQLTNFVHAELKERGFAIAFLIARKAVDHFYNSFGYLGLSRYEKVEINALNDRLDEPCRNFEVFNGYREEDVLRYIEAYSKSYSGCDGATKRDSEKDWQLIAQKVEKSNGILFRSIFCNEKCVGYLIDSDKVVFELALSEDKLPGLVEKLFAEGTKTFELSRQHRCRSLFSGHDLVSSQRTCPFGGHMVKILDEKELPCDGSNSFRVLKLYTDRYREGGKLSQVVQHIFGIDWSFNIPFADQV